MLEKILDTILDKANFNIVISVLAVEGIIYYFTREWPDWTILNAVIFFCVGYCLSLLIKWCFLKIKKYRNRNKYEQVWAKMVLDDFMGLAPLERNLLVYAYKKMEIDPINKNQRYSSEPNLKMELAKLYRTHNFYISKGDDSLYIPKPYIEINVKSDYVTVTFDPVICEKLDICPLTT